MKPPPDIEDTLENPMEEDPEALFEAKQEAETQANRKSKMIQITNSNPPIYTDPQGQVLEYTNPLNEGTMIGNLLKMSDA